jgi:predicted DNA-binding protein
MSLDSITLTNEVMERLDDVPSHTVVSMHRIIKETLAVLVDHGYIAYDESREEE